MVTKFKLDERLQVTVPMEMRTENPDGVATYTNFRRFGVETRRKFRHLQLHGRRNLVEQ